MGNVCLSSTLVGSTAPVTSSTVLKLDSISVSDVKPGDPIEVKGLLVDYTSAEGIADKEINLAVTGIEDLPAEKTTTKTGGNVKFTFTIPINVSLEAGQ